MDASGEVADLMVKESIQLTEESIKLLAAGCKNLTAFLYALAKDNKKLVGKTSMKRLLREGKELKTFCIKAEDLNDFRKYAKPNILFAAIRDTKEDDGVVALVTNTDFVSPVNLFMQRRGYPAPTQTQEDDSDVSIFLERIQRVIINAALQKLVLCHIVSLHSFPQRPVINDLPHHISCLIKQLYVVF